MEITTNDSDVSENCTKAVRFSSKTVLKSVQNKAIYLGAMMSDEDKQSVIHLAKKLNQKSRYIR